MIINLEVPDDTDLHDVRIVLMDAFSEYVSHRANGNALEYVNKRYPGESVYTAQAKQAKLESVRKRCDLARTLHGAAFQI